MVSRNDDDNDKSLPQPGIGVDSKGGGVIDPTKNVLDLVKAESKYQDAQRESLKELLLSRINTLAEQVKLISDGALSFQNAQRDSETRRIDQLATTRQEFQNTIRDMLAESVRTTSNLVSTQLVQIQATFDTRVSKLEEGAFTQAGKSSVADPVMSDAIAKMSSSIATVQSVQVEATAKLTAALAGLQSTNSQLGGQETGKKDTTARLVAIAAVVASFVLPIISIAVTVVVMRGR